MHIHLTSLALFRASAKAAFVSAGCEGGGIAFPKEAILKFITCAVSGKKTASKREKDGLLCMTGQILETILF